jgi:hypothetical protein
LTTGNATPADWDLLRARGPLAVVAPRVLREMIAAAEPRTYAPGDVLIEQGAKADGLLILLEGRAHAALHDQDGAHYLGDFAAGDLVGEMALVTRERRTADVIADAPVRALLVRTKVFDRLATRYLELATILTQLIADRLGHGTRDGFGGKRVEGFRILKCVGRGGMSVVYRAREEASGDLVALKMMSYRLIYDPVSLSRFQHEAALVQQLAHENITRLRRLFPAFHTYFLVMELCEGVDLSHLLTVRRRLPEREVRGIVGQLANALDYVHRRGVVHRDLKPANVMITREGDVKLTDFGIASTESGDSAGTAEFSLLGTPSYMAPEQLSGGPLDGRTDVYALGCLAYELLTGTRLFASPDLFRLIQQKLTPKLPPAAEIAGGVSAGLYDFLDRSLRVNPDDRPSLEPIRAWAARADPPPEPLVIERSDPAPLPPTVWELETRVDPGGDPS